MSSGTGDLPNPTLTSRPEAERAGLVAELDAGAARRYGARHPFQYGRAVTAQNSSKRRRYGILTTRHRFETAACFMTQKNRIIGEVSQNRPDTAGEFARLAESRTHAGKSARIVAPVWTKNRSLVLLLSTIMRRMDRACRLVVISPADPPRAGAHHRGKKVRGRLPPRIFAAVSQRLVLLCHTGMLT